MKKLINITIGIIRDRETRRWAMFILVIAALAMTLLGGTLMAEWIAQSLMRFLLFWAICGWLTLTVMLLAIFDILAVRVEARRERKALRHEVFTDKDEEQKDRR